MSKEICTHEGNSLDLVFRVTDPKGCVFDLGAVTAVRFGLSSSPGREASTVLTLGNGVLISDAGKGVITVQLDAQHTAKAGRRVYELTVEIGTDVYTAATGELEVLPSILA